MQEGSLSVYRTEISPECLQRVLLRLRVEAGLRPLWSVALAEGMGTPACLNCSPAMWCPKTEDKRTGQWCLWIFHCRHLGRGPAASVMDE